MTTSPDAGIEALRARVEALEAELAAERSSRTLSRRGLLAGALGASAALAGTMLGASPAGAATGGNFVLGQANSADTDATTLASTSADAVLRVQQDSSASGTALDVHVTSTSANGRAVNIQNEGHGPAIVASGAPSGSDAVVEVYAADNSAGLTLYATNGTGANFSTTSGTAVNLQADTGKALSVVQTNSATTNDTMTVTHPGTHSAINAAATGNGHALYAHAVGSGASVWATGSGKGAAVYGQQSGTGSAVYASVTNSASTASAVYGITNGNAVAVEGVANYGRGGRFRGRYAQINLVPGLGATHPTSGTSGDFYVDRFARLWFCRNGTSWVQIA
jgi:hypothetical protein